MRFAQDRALANMMWIIASNHHAAMKKALDQLYDFIRGMGVRPDPKECAEAEGRLTFAEDWVTEAMRECIEAEARYNWVHCTFHGRMLDMMSEQAGSTVPILRGQLLVYDGADVPSGHRGGLISPNCKYAVFCGLMSVRSCLDPSQRR